MNQYYLFFIFSLLIISCRSIPSPNNNNIVESGVASWYGPQFHGKKTANGERFDMNGLTAAHRTLPFNTVVKVENQLNGKEVDVRINDRGPFAKDRIIDLSKKAAERIDMIGPGTANVHLRIVKSSGRKLPNDLKVQAFTIQLASFQSKQSADSEKSRVPGSWIQKVDVQGKTVYRLFYGRYKTADEANNNLQQLKHKGIDGFVKQVEN